MNEVLTWRELIKRDGVIPMIENALKADHRIAGEIYPILKTAAERENVNEHDFIIIFLAICDCMGGMQVYFPKGSALKILLKKHMIYKDFTGNNLTELSIKYKLSEVTIYRYVNEMRDEIGKIKSEAKVFIEQLTHK